MPLLFGLYKIDPYRYVSYYMIKAVYESWTEKSITQTRIVSEVWKDQPIHSMGFQSARQDIDSYHPVVRFAPASIALLSYWLDTPWHVGRAESCTANSISTQSA